MKENKSVLYIIIAVLTVLVIILLGNKNDDNAYLVDSVKNGILENCPNYSVEHLLSSVAADITWNQQKSDMGYDVVNATGTTIYSGKEVELTAQFAIVGDKIVMQKYEVDKQEITEVDGLISNMCQNSFIYEKGGDPSKIDLSLIAYDNFVLENYFQLELPIVLILCNDVHICNDYYDELLDIVDNYTYEVIFKYVDFGVYPTLEQYLTYDAIPATYIYDNRGNLIDSFMGNNILKLTEILDDMKKNS